MFITLCSVSTVIPAGLDHGDDDGVHPVRQGFVQTVTLGHNKIVYVRIAGLAVCVYGTRGEGGGRGG